MPKIENNQTMATNVTMATRNEFETLFKNKTMRVPKSYKLREVKSKMQGTASCHCAIV